MELVKDYMTDVQQIVGVWDETLLKTVKVMVDLVIDSVPIFEGGKPNKLGNCWGTLTFPKIDDLILKYGPDRVIKTLDRDLDLYPRFPDADEGMNIFDASKRVKDAYGVFVVDHGTNIKGIFNTFDLLKAVTKEEFIALPKAIWVEKKLAGILHEQGIYEPPMTFEMMINRLSWIDTIENNIEELQKDFHSFRSSRNKVFHSIGLVEHFVDIINRDWHRFYLELNAFKKDR